MLIIIIIVIVIMMGNENIKDTHKYLIFSSPSDQTNKVKKKNAIYYGMLFINFLTLFVSI